MQKLNARERAVLDYIRRLTVEKGYAPSVRDIGEALGYKSTSTVQMYLDRLEAYGYIRREGGKSRSISLCEEPRTIPIPILREGVPVDGDLSDADFEGVLDFCLCKALPSGTALFARRTEEPNGYEVFLDGRVFARIKYL